jgi:hypothetical protein
LGVALTVKKNVYGLTLAFALLFSAAGFLLDDSTKAQVPEPLPYVPIIQINGDGSITPETDLISRNGNTYTLTANIDGYKLLIACSNIVLDGNGYTLTLYAGDNPAIHLLNDANVRAGLENVKIKNIEIFAFYYAISMYHCSRCHISGVKTSQRIRLAYSDYNTITENTAQIQLVSDELESSQSNNNLLFKNNITGLVFTGVKSWVESNVFYKNNMLFEGDDELHIFSSPKDTSWDNGSVGNYWSDYLEKYPNASEVGNTGIGDTPYVVDADNVDYYPLIYPYDIEKDAIAFPTLEPFLTGLVIAASASIAVIAGVFLLVYFRKKGRGSGK